MNNETVTFPIPNPPLTFHERIDNFVFEIERNITGIRNEMLNSRKESEIKLIQNMLGNLTNQIEDCVWDSFRQQILSEP